MITLEKLLTNKFNVDSKDIEKAQSYQQRYGGKLEQILVNMGSLSDDKLAPLYSEYLDLPLFDLSQWSLDDFELPEMENHNIKFLVDNDWVPLEITNGSIVCATKAPLNLAVHKWLQQHSLIPKIFVADEISIQAFKSVIDSSTSDSAEIESLSGDEEERLRELASEAPTVNLLNSLIGRALREGASDMHLEPYEGRYRVRYRIDGVLHEIELLSSRMQLPLVTRLKILSGMDIAEKRRPQDGKIEMRIANQEIDIRVSSLPLNEGESIVMRFLRKDSVRYDMSVLGLSEDIQALIQEDLATTAGVILLTGPTGSGKTTSLYTFLNKLNNDDVKIITLEDPVEYQLEGINQVQVNAEIGFDFASGLRSIVRQDPDIIMLGEIRDRETSQIALQSALTGHLVFSTVHTNDAPSAYTRLIDLGVEEFLLNAALVSIVAQRLARKVCPHCAKPHSDSERLKEKYKLSELAESQQLDKINLVEAKGCEKCSNTGYKGRLAVIEYLRCDEDVKAMPKDENFIGKAKAHNKSLNRRTLLEDGLYKALQGLTTIDEVLRVAG